MLGQAHSRGPFQPSWEVGSIETHCEKGTVEHRYLMIFAFV